MNTITSFAIVFFTEKTKLKSVDGPTLLCVYVHGQNLNKAAAPFVCLYV